ncbi:MAG TPA: hypothetical protein VGB77_17670 [Abditibacteriaceae bacterium]
MFSPFSQGSATSIGPLWIAWVLPFTLQVSFAFFLWVFAVSLGRSLIASGQEHEKISSWHPREVICVALSLFGATMLIREINNIAMQLVDYANMQGVSPAFPLTMLIHLPALILGSMLLFGARLLSFWLSPRSLEVEPQASSDAES